MSRLFQDHHNPIPFARQSLNSGRRSNGSSYTAPDPGAGEPQNRLAIGFGNLLLAFRHAVRSLIRRPLMTFISALTLALGIGACTIVFSITYHTTIRTLPFPDSHQLVGINQLTPELTGSDPSLNRLYYFWMIPYAHYRDWAEMSTSYAAMGAYSPRGVTLTAVDEAVRLTGMRLTSGVFSALEVEAALGRTLQPEDDIIGAPPVTVLSHAIWENRFGSDPSIIGRDIHFSGMAYTVVGIMPRGFLFPYEGISCWFNFSDAEKTSPSRVNGYLKVIARLKPDISLDQAQAEMNRIAHNLGVEYPAEEEHGVRVTSYHRLIVGGSDSGLAILIAAVVMVLLITCANIAGLLLVRAMERHRELAVRAALGAGRRNLIMQSLGESLLLSLFGGLLGLGIAVCGLRPFLAVYPGLLPPSGEVTVDPVLFAVALLLAVLVGILIGLVPALRTVRTPAMATIRDASGRTSGGRQRNRTQAGLVVAQVTLSFVLLAGASLMVKSYRWLNRVDLGYDTRNTLIMTVVLPNSYHSSGEERLGFFSELFDRLEALPGMAGVAAIEQVPFLSPLSSPSIYVETATGNVMAAIHESNVSPSYFEVMNIPIISGRGFSSADRLDTPLMTVVNQTLVERFWPDENPIGRRLNAGSEDNPIWLTVIGVAADTRYRPQSQPIPEFYVSIEQYPEWYLNVLMKTTTDPLALAAPARAVVRELDASIPIEVDLYDERIRDSRAMSMPRFSAWAFGALALVAAVLTVIGLYGTLAFVVVRQTRDIGIRIALGADRWRVIRSVLGRGLTLVAVGLALGLGIALVAGNVLQAALFGIQPADPLTLIEVGVLVIAAGLAASWLPARRATAVDPISCLRQE